TRFPGAVLLRPVAKGGGVVAVCANALATLEAIKSAVAILHSCTPFRIWVGNASARTEFRKSFCVRACDPTNSIHSCWPELTASVAVAILTGDWGTSPEVRRCYRCQHGGAQWAYRPQVVTAGSKKRPSSASRAIQSAQRSWPLLSDAKRLAPVLQFPSIDGGVGSVGKTHATA